MRLRHLPCLTLFAGLSLVAPAMAFDDLLSAVGLLPPVTDSPQAFTYVAPSYGFELGTDLSFGRLDDQQLSQALVRGEKDSVSGVDFGKVDGSLSFGVPPKVTTVLFGEPGFAADAPEALLARGFSEREDPIPLFWRGDDYFLDMASARDPDPFGSGLGRAQRLAIADDFLIRTAGWAEMDLALKSIAEPPAYSSMWADTILAIKDQAGTDATLEVASGWTLFAFSGPSPMDRLGPRPGGKIKIKTPELEPSLVFPFAVIALTQNAESAGLHIAIPYSDPDMAERAGAVIAGRLSDLPISVGAPNVVIAPARDVENSMQVMVLTIDTPLDSVTDAQALYSTWMTAIFRRDFQPLMSGA